MKKAMKKIIIAAFVIVVVIAGFMVVKNRFGGMQVFSGRMSSGTDLLVINDSAKTISVEYKDGGQNIAVTLAPGESASGGQGLIRVFTSEKSGVYELTYQYPLSMGSTREITLSQMVDAGTKDMVDNEIYVKKGMVGDVTVAYEEAQPSAN